MVKSSNTWDMETSSINFKKQFDELLIRFLWRQWSALGIAGHAAADDPWMIDPEALLLFSTVVARNDPRFFDEILDWLQQNGSWINLQRLTRLQKEYQPGDSSIMAAIASHLSRNSAHAKWKIFLHQGGSDATPAPARPLFPGIPLLGTPDEDFLRLGWQRGPIRLRGLSQPPSPNQPATFLIKLRALFGRQSRAEVIAWLLAHESGHPAEIARQLGYFRRSIQLVLNELASSGHVDVVRSSREKHFAIRHDEWRFLLTWKSDGHFPKWIHWGSLFRMLRGLHELLEQPGFETMSQDLRIIEINRVLKVDALVQTHMPIRLPHSSVSGEDFLDEILAGLKALLG